MWSTFWVGYQTYLKAQQTVLYCLIVTQDVREKATRIFRAEEREIIANESTMDRDSPTYLAHFDSDSFHIGIDTICTQTLSGNKNHFQDLRLYNGKSVTGIPGGLEITGEGTFVFQIEDDDAELTPSRSFAVLCARSEVASFVSPTLGRDSQGQSPNQLWKKN